MTIPVNIFIVFFFNKECMGHYCRSVAQKQQETEFIMVMQDVLWSQKTWVDNIVKVYELTSLRVYLDLQWGADSVIWAISLKCRSIPEIFSILNMNIWTPSKYNNL